MVDRYFINGEALLYRELVTIDGSQVTTETGIPLMLNINLPGVKALGADVRLAHLDGSPIAREIECKDVPNTDDVTIHYPFDTVSATDSQFWVYWGNANLTEPAASSTYGSEAVWASTYKIVQSLFSNSNDSTSNAVSFTDTGIDYSNDSADFAENADDITASTAILENTDFSYTFILKYNQINPGGVVIQYGRLTASPYYGITINADTTDGSFNLFSGTSGSYNNWNPATPVSKDNDWSVVTFRKVGGNVYFKIDDSSEATTTWDAVVYSASFRDLVYGEYADTSSGLIMGLKRVRISSSGYSANYTDTIHKNLNNPTATGTAPFYKSFGNPQHQRRHPQFQN